jgi:hypothetical protein
MLEQVGLNLRLATALNVLTGYLALASVRGYSPVLIAIPLLAIALTGRFQSLHANHKMVRNISLGVTIAYFCFIPLTIVVLNAVPALIALIIFIQCHLLMHKKNERHYYYLVLMTFFLVLAACVQSPEPIIAPVLLLFILSSAWAMSALRLEADPYHARAHAEPEIKRLRERNAAAPPTTPGRLPIALTITLSSLAILGLTGLFFFLTPRVEAGFLGRDSAMIRVTGFAQTVDLQGGTYVQEDHTPVMQVTLSGEAGERMSTSQMYWRVATLASYDQSRWSRKGLDTHYYPGIGELFAENMSEFRHSGDNPHEAAREAYPGNPPTVQQRIFSDRLPNEGIPMLDLPLKIQVEGRASDKQIGWDGRQDMTFRMTRGNNNQLDYTAWSEIVTHNIEELRTASLGPLSLSEEDLELLTRHDLLPETQELVRELTGPYNNAYDKANAVLQYLTGQDFLYTLNLPDLPEQNAIDAFILQSKRGHCEFFASAMALMLRADGIPTRVVSGYRGADWSDGTDAYIVRQSMAHLWLEVFIEGHGWVRFDPAPPRVEAPVGGVLGFLQMINDLQLRAKLFWYREVISFDRGLQLERLRSLPGGIFRSLGFARSLEESTTTSNQTGADRLSTLLVGSVLVAFVGGLLVLLLRRRNEAFPLTRDQRQAIKMFDELRTRLAKHGINVAGLAAEEIETEISRRGWTEFGDIQAMLLLYNEVRFGQRPLESSRFNTLRTRLRALRPNRA